MKRLTFMTLATCLGLTSTAIADIVCMDAAEMEAALIDWYGETPVPGAWAAEQQLWASDAAGTWTLVELGADDTACVLSQGKDWSAADDPIVAFGRTVKGTTSETAIAFLDLLRDRSS